MRRSPIALFDGIDQLDKISPPSYLDANQRSDYEASRDFLKKYRFNVGTFNSYRREVERLLHWTWHINNQHLDQTESEDIHSFIAFCQKPPIAWIGTKAAPRFLVRDGIKVPNTDWRPFISRPTKAERRDHKVPDKKSYKASNGSIRQLITIIGVFYSHLAKKEHIYSSPAARIPQLSAYITKEQTFEQRRRLSTKQLEYLIESTKELAEQEPGKHERSLFIVSCLFGMYLRISEITASERWTPMMNDFSKDSDGHWWFTTVGKGNKKREIAVSDSMLKALKRWRKYLGLSALPPADDSGHLFPSLRGSAALSDTTHIRDIVQICYDKAISKLESSGEQEEADQMKSVTVHWLRHTGISEDVKHRPKEHVRDDAGHKSIATTDRYINIEKSARHRSAKNKKI